MNSFNLQDRHKEKLTCVDSLLVDKVRSVVKFLFDNGDLKRTLNCFVSDSDLLTSEFLELFVDDTVAKQEGYRIFSLDSLICRKCNDIIKDPVTLKCGHTFSKKCLLLETNQDCFFCTECKKSYSVCYLLQLKNNVTILCLAEKIYRKYKGLTACAKISNVKINGVKQFLSELDDSFFEKQEFECSLCYRIFWEPVTTACGHTFCRDCLNRCLDHRPACPLCNASLNTFLADRVQNINQFLDFAIRNLFPSDYAERQALHLKELERLANAGKDIQHEIPLFVCTVALPTVPCPLHVFEPRYRLMIRQCMESGGKQFGMCAVVNNEIAEYGTILVIKNVQYFPDGRSIVDTVGSKRFQILRKGERDGYDIGAVEILQDQPIRDRDLLDLSEKHFKIYKISKDWFMHLPTDTRDQFLKHFGPMPTLENNLTTPDGPSWLWWMLAILPVETRLKVWILSLTSLSHRLNCLYRILVHLQSDIS